MLIPEQIALLQWILEQDHAVSKQNMKISDAPGYTSNRVENMRKEGFLERHLGIENDEIEGLYTVSDKGKALLLEHEEHCRKESESQAQQKFQNRISLAQVLLPIITFVLGLLAEHFGGVVDVIRGIFF